MANPEKAAAVTEIADQFRESSGAVLTEYRGLSVKQLQELRHALSGSATYAVAKNSLTKIAAEQAGVDLDESLLVGPTAIAFITGDAVEAAKGLRNFSKDNTSLVVKGGIVDGQPLTVDEFKRLADLESREVLLSKLAGGMQASLSRAASLFNAPLLQAARAAAALRDKAEQDPSILADTGGDAGPSATDEVSPGDSTGDSPNDSPNDSPSDSTDDSTTQTQE